MDRNTLEVVGVLGGLLFLGACIFLAIKYGGGKKNENTKSTSTEGGGSVSSKNTNDPNNSLQNNKTLTDAEAQCYLDRYADVKNAFGSDLEKAKTHWKVHGSVEGRNPDCSFSSNTKPILHWVNSLENCDGIPLNNVISYKSYDGFEIGPSLATWGCQNYNTDMQVVTMELIVPNANTINDPPTNVSSGGLFVVENPNNLPLPDPEKQPTTSLKPILHWVNSLENCDGIPSDNVIPYATYDGFDIGPSLVTWGCQNYNTDMQVVEIGEEVPNANTINNTPQDVSSGGIYVVENPNNLPLPESEVVNENFLLFV